MITNPGARGTSSNYLSRRLPTLNPEEGKHNTILAPGQHLDLLKGLIDITPIVGRDIGLMIRAFAAALEDDNLLVRRAALDLLVTSLRLNSVSVKNSRAEDRAILMRASYSVILRRDLALNRRLYLWLLGPDENAKQQDAYFRENALDLLKYTLEVAMFYIPCFIVLTLDQRRKCSNLQPSIPNLALSRFSFRCSTSGKSEDLSPKSLCTMHLKPSSCLWKQIRITLKR